MFIFSNLAMSLDGKIATKDRTFFPLGTSEDKKQMQVLRRKCDALLVGASTFRCYQKASMTLGARKQPLNAVMSSSLEGFSPLWPFFLEKKIERVLFVGHKARPEKIRKFELSSEIIVLKNPTIKHPIALQVLKFFEKKGIQNLLVEGGGEVMWHFASRNLIQEYHVTLTPKILGGAQAPTLVDGAGFNSKTFLPLKLRQCKIVGDEVYLTYSNGIYSQD